MTLVAARQAIAAAPPLQPDLSGPGMGALAVHWLPAEDWDAAAGPWERLAARAAPNPFLLPVFALAARLIDPAPGLGAFVLMRDGEWLGFVPGRLRFKVFTLWTHDYAVYAQPLAAAGEEALVAARLAGWLREQGTLAIDWPYGEASPLLAAFAHIDTIDAHERACLTHSRPLSKEHRRLWRRLGEQGDLALLSTAMGYDQDAALAAFLGLEAGGWKGARGTAFAALEHGEAFVRAGIGGLMRKGHARIDLISLSGRPVAAGVAVTAGDRAWYWKTAYDEAFARFSPGVLVSHALGEGLLGQARLVDSCAIPGHPMIDRLWPGRLAIAHRFIAVTPGAGYRVALALRRAYVHGRAAVKRLLGR